ncbi:hypothetical protein Cgig2_014535 [Carnegiea gigantea]|uniref:Uncharacterized protein n=1 Tax=Carnegiea gigantea TaxID=171969 RepID=A0A9Q1K0M2_9CARY|nr:hypothetical protein Cgig2_014535 [Carnegiea gigantea]
MKTAEVEAKLDEENIEEAESSLREGLSLNSEVSSSVVLSSKICCAMDVAELEAFTACGEARTLLGKLENVESALRVFEGIDLQAAIERFQPSDLDKQATKKDRPDSVYAVPQHAANVVLEAICLKAKSLQKLGRFIGQETSKLQEIVSRAVQLLPELWSHAGSHIEAIAAYRHALLSQWNLDDDCCARIQKKFAVFHLYSGVEAGAPSLSVQIDAKQIEEVMPGTFNRVDRWNALALCHIGAMENKEALNLLRKSLHKNERPNDLQSLLLAAKICSGDTHLAVEGVGYARRALTVAMGNEEDLKVQYVEHHNAMHYAKQFIDATGGSMLKVWKLLALILSSEKQFSDAQLVIDAALDETAKWEQGPLLRMKAKLKILQSLPMDAIETYRQLLALVQAQRKSFGPIKTYQQGDNDRVNEFEVWLGLAKLYSTLSHWKDIEVCLEKACSLRQYSAETLYTEGLMLEGKGQLKEALAAYSNALLLDPDYVPCKILLGGLLSKKGSNALPVAKSLLSDALRIEPTNRKAWHYLGMVHRNDGRHADAAECFQAASMKNLTLLRALALFFYFSLPFFNPRLSSPPPPREGEDTTGVLSYSFKFLVFFPSSRGNRRVFAKT